jgi:hypothetical protein
MSGRVLVATAALLATGLPAVAQTSVRLRFAPQRGVAMQRVFQTHTRLSLPAQDAGVMQVREVGYVGGATQSMLGRRRQESVVHVNLDSLRSRMREAGGPWREVRMAGLDSVWMQVTLDEQMHVLRQAAATAGLGRDLLLQLLTGAPGLVVPARPVRRGEQWRAELDVGLGDVALGAPASGPERLSVRATVVVDSIVARSHDTLAYLSLRGPVEPRGVSAPGGRTLRYAGGMTGGVVWSTGWGGVVSTAIRFELRIDAPAAPGDRTTRPVTIETTIRHAVVP